MSPWYTLNIFKKKKKNEGARKWSVCTYTLNAFELKQRIVIMHYACGRSILHFIDENLKKKIISNKKKSLRVGDLFVYCNGCRHTHLPTDIKRIFIQISHIIHIIINITYHLPTSLRLNRVYVTRFVKKQILNNKTVPLPNLKSVKPWNLLFNLFILFNFFWVHSKFYRTIINLLLFANFDWFHPNLNLFLFC